MEAEFGNFEEVCIDDNVVIEKCGGETGLDAGAVWAIIIFFIVFVILAATIWYCVSSSKNGFYQVNENGEGCLTEKTGVNWVALVVSIFIVFIFFILIASFAYWSSSEGWNVEVEKCESRRNCCNNNGAFFFWLIILILLFWC